LIQLALGVALASGDAGAQPPATSKPTPAKAVDHGSRQRPEVALTFDLCSGSPPGKLDDGVVEALEKNQTKATFFVGGVWAEQDPERVKRLSANSRFELESHAYHHPHLTELSDKALEAEIAKATQTLAPMFGRPPRYLRAPYGESNARVVRAARAQGLTVIGFDVPSGDPDPEFGKKRLTRWVLREVKPGSIVVFHANGRGWHTAEALPDILEGLRKKGLTPVTVSELLAGEAD